MQNSNSLYHGILYHMRKMLFSSKTIVVFLLGFTFLYSATAPLMEITRLWEYRTSPWFYCFIYQQSYWNILLNFCIIFMLSDAPFIDNNFSFLCIRLEKKNWITSCYVSISICALIFSFWLFFMSLFSAIPNVFFSFDWGKVLSTISNVGRLNSFFVSEKIITCYNPLIANLHTVFLQALLGTFLGSVMFYFNLFFKKSIGIGIAAFIVLSKLMFSGVWTKLSPATLTCLDRIDYPWHSYVILSFGILLLYLLSIKMIKTRDL